MPGVILRVLRHVLLIDTTEQHVRVQSSSIVGVTAHGRPEIGTDIEAYLHRAAEATP